MEHADFLELASKLQERFDNRYVKSDDCEEKVEKNQNRIDNLTLEFAKNNTKLNIVIGILSAIALPIVSVCINMLFGG